MASKFPQKVCSCNASYLPHKHEDGGIVDATPEEVSAATHGATAPRASAGVGFVPAR
jgi:hypothetical protein